MEAILELFIALIIQPILWSIQFVAFLFGLVIEFTLTAATKGIAEAKSSASAKMRAHQEIQRNKQINQLARQSSSWERWSVLVGCLIFVGFIVFQIVSFRIQRQREELTRKQIAEVADGIVSRELPKNGDAKNPRVLDDRDAWGTPLQLFINDFMLGKLVVIRSMGADVRPGTVDDQLAIRWKGVAKPKILGNAFDFADEQFRKMLAKLLDIKDLRNLPKQIGP